MTEDTLWYKNAVFYELHVRAFYDSNGDGMGDLKGVTAKLDYLQELGVDCVWLLPFYPSPLKDDGYDVSDFYNVHPDVGTIDDFKELIAEAHKRGIKVIADMIFNHVSSEHGWFQEARNFPDSKKHDYFVWSDTGEEYKDVRIIFTDTEPSNWAWDSVAKKYYWHRFFSHQPDLNYDNPDVRQEMKNVVRFWLSMGLDGFRCDAVPYLFEREGTNGENLPETHQFFKELRKMIDDEFPGVIFLAEANQWLTETIDYFGDGTGDEFHMAFNFPLMPRLYYGIAKADRTAIVDIINQTQEIPENAQWATFLRNHDELTLEMVTDEERDFMYEEYAKHPKMRLNLGIRRRLAPLVGNDRLTIELMLALLLSLPGSPVIYYGDELGMGDNVFLGDRNGVRTPMQWSPDANAGFSKILDPEMLYLPPITNPSYHYESVNVRVEEQLKYSLLNWSKKIITVRKKSQAFGRGDITVLNPENKRIFAFIRSYKNEHVMCIYNLSRWPQYVHLDLGDFEGYTLVEMSHGSEFPEITKDKYAFSLTGHRFLWFELQKK